MSEASGHRGLWTEPKYPGDTVRVLHLKRRDERGSIRIQQYDTFVKVGSFLPGVVEQPPGDSPKVWPEKSTMLCFGDPADACFDDYVQTAYAEFWERDYAKDPD